MKAVMFIGCAAIIGGGIYFHGAPAEANVFPVPLQETYAKLRAHHAEKSGKLYGATFGNLETETSGKPGKSIMWSVKDTDGRISCEAHLIPVDAANTKIIPKCQGGGEGAATGMMMKMRVNSFIEMLDATMNDRPYNPELASGATATRWPKQEIENADIFSAQNEALKMQAEMQSQIDESK